MKKREIFTTEDYIEVSETDIVDDFIAEAFDLADWVDKDNLPTSDSYDYFWENYTGLTPEKIETIFKLIKVAVEEEVEEAKKYEQDLLQDRKSILNFLSKVLDESYLNYGEVGFSLSREEILDLILKNGNK